MNFCRLTCCLLLALICNLTSASPKVRNWDKLLDRYETLCDKCLELKQQADDGEEIEPKKFSKLIRELNSLKTELKEASGQMSLEQAARFAQIRDRFLEAQGHKERPPKTVPPVPVMHAPAVAPPQVIVLQRTVTRTAQPLIKPEDFVVVRPERELPCPRFIEREESVALDVPAAERKPASKSLLLGRKYYLSGIVNVSVVPKASYGLFIGLDPLESPFGAYIRASSNFADRRFDYDCLSDGTTSFGSLWASGRGSYFTAQASLGPCYRLNSWLRVFGGLGYGSVLTLWEDSSGQWARVLDYSPHGLLFEAGAIFNLGRVDLSLGYSCTALKISELQLGIGYNF